MVRAAAGRKATMPKHIIPARPPVVISSLEPWARVVVQCRRGNPDTSNQVPLAKGSLDNSNPVRLLKGPSPDSTNQGRQPKGNPDSTSPVPSKGSPVNTNPVSLFKDSPANITPGRPQSSLANTSQGRLPQSKRGRHEKRLSLNITSQGKNLVRSGK